MTGNSIKQFDYKPNTFTFLVYSAIQKLQAVTIL